MATTISMTYSATTITLRTNRKPSVDPWRPRQKIGVSLGGQVKVSQRGTADQFYELNFTRLTSTEKTDLEGFIKNTVLGHFYAFSFTDWNSVVHSSVRFWEIGNFEQTSNNSYSFTCKLRAEIT